jgi:hypothetical protein
MSQDAGSVISADAFSFSDIVKVCAAAGDLAVAQGTQRVAPISLRATIQRCAFITPPS